MTGNAGFTVWSVAVCLTLVACSAAPPPEEGASPDTRAQSLSDPENLPPPGYGTLRQDDFTVAFQSGEVQVKLTPLAEPIIRLAAPDTYQRLHGLVNSRDLRIKETSRNAGLSREPLVFLVSFFTYSQQAEFKPTDLQLLSQGKLYRPLGILPLTPEWGREQVKQQQTQSALYVFDPAIDLDVEFQAEYGGQRSLAWASIIRALQAERGRVLSRVKS